MELVLPTRCSEYGDSLTQLSQAQNVSKSASAHTQLGQHHHQFAQGQIAGKQTNKHMTAKYLPFSLIILK